MRPSTVSLFMIVFVAFLSIFSRVIAQQSCDAGTICDEGCCSSFGSCGFGPDYCGDGCQNSCNATAECGQYAPEGSFDCPLNVCCSKYGYCGTTSQYCTDCQNEDGCPAIVPKTCPENSDALNITRRIAYYELWAPTRPCDNFEPEQIAAGALTHINIAFATITSDFKITDTSGALVARVSRLKKRYPGLRVNIAIGGWSFNDPPTQNIFSDMVSTADSRATFINSVVVYLQKYALDGVDIDWEYPVADDRGGVEADYDNYVVLLSQLRDKFDSINTGWELTITLPSSYWYLRGFNLENMQKYVSWFNVMTYDIHGVWDLTDKFVGPYLAGHTNITEISDGLDLLWHNGVKPENVVMGFGFYGRSFTMTDPKCFEPNGVCTYGAAGVAGDCTGQAGILSYSEVVSRNFTLNSQTYYDPVSTVKYMIYGGDQWISYDDEQSFTDKKKFLSGLCISGMMIWAIDQDTMDYQALTALLGEAAMQDSLIEGGDLSDDEKSALSEQLSAYTGENCYVTPTCTDGTNSQQQHDQVCNAGFRSISTAHAPQQKAGDKLNGACSKGWYRHICCPTDAMPQNCQWNGAPERSEFGCDGSCASDQFLLNIDSYVDADGEGSCYSGHRDLCCDSTEILDECAWTDCQSSYKCPNSALPAAFTYRSDNDDGSLCDPSGGDSSFRTFCCPAKDTYSNCAWSNNQGVADPDTICNPSACPDTQLQVTTAKNPPSTTYTGAENIGSAVDCSMYPLPAGTNPDFPYCCNPPQEYNEKWPVDPSYLWSDPHSSKNDSVSWSYADNYGNNNKEKSEDADLGADPYGFIMLDGPPGTVSNSFAEDFTVARRNEIIPLEKMKRDLLTTNRTIIESNFDHMEETIYVYCNHPQGSPECQSIFHQGVEDTIIKLPNHVGEGPFARVISMEPREEDYKLPSHHIKDRLVKRNFNTVYKVTFDYNFHLIKRGDEVNLRIDYTNLLPYWTEMTAAKPDSKKRSEESGVPEHAKFESYKHWRSSVDQAKKVHRSQYKKRDLESFDVTESSLAVPTSLPKRWFGAFKAWLVRLTTVTLSDSGYLPLSIKKSILLYKASKGCEYSTAQASLEINVDASISMDARWAYYFSGTITGVTDTYAYFGLEPSMYLGLRINGEARLQYTSDRQKIIDTLSYPGLAIKGLAAVGPTFNLYGQIRGIVQIAGTMQIGATYNFEAAEVYWPEDIDPAATVIADLVSLPTHNDAGIVPEFGASVTASADLDILVTPEVDMGLKIGGGVGIIKGTLMDAQLVGFVNNTLRFHVEATGTTDGTSASATYKYGVYLLYNVGYGGYANFINGLYTWAVTSQYLFDTDKKITLYEPPAVVVSTSKRSIPPPDFKLPRRGLLNSHDNLELNEPYAILESISTGKAPVFSNTKKVHETSDVEDASELTKRLDIGQVTEFAEGWFDCPGNKTGCSSGLSTRDTLLESRANTPGCVSVLPVLSYNCDNWFMDRSNTIETVPGICQGIRRFFSGRAIVNDFTLTFDRDQARSQTRRNTACGRQACFAENINYENSLGVSGLTSCDEFPFASTEEGGDYYGLAREIGNTGAQANCVPVSQQDIQGKNCNDLLNQISMNVAEGTDPANWVSFSNDAQWVANTVTGFGRTALYPNAIPQAANIDSLAFTASGNKLGYMFKRNFTFHLASPGAGGSTAWGSQAFTSGTNKVSGTAFTASTNIACAINTMGEANYRYDSGYNGWCWDQGPLNWKDGGLWQVRGIVQCKITFAGSPGPTKRSIGTYNGWEIEDIVLSDNPEHFIPLEGNLHVNNPGFIASRGDLGIHMSGGSD